MAKPIISQTIRMDGRAFQKGQEAELLDASTAEQRKEWSKAGLIDGDWTARGFEGDESESEESAEEIKTLNAADIETKILADLNESLEDIAAQISGLLGISRVSDESAFVFIKRFADEEVPLIAEQLRATSTGEPKPGADPFEPLNANVAKALRGAGIETGEQVKATGDETLLAINGIADASVKQLRELFGAYESAE